MRIAIVQGTRPEIIKNYSLVNALSESGVEFEVLHTGQHHSGSMAGNIYHELGYQPQRSLPGPYNIGKAIEWLQQCYRNAAVSHVIVNGDTAASVAGALAAMYMDIDVSHVEAGLRSGDPHMREERNRIMVDTIATLLFAYTSIEKAELEGSSHTRGDVFLEGNTTVDLLHDFAGRTTNRLFAHRYVYATLHRKEFTDSMDRMHRVFGALRRIARDNCPVVLPMHPRTADALARSGLPESTLDGIDVIEPVSAFASLSLQRHAAAVITDSGCIQEEAYLLKVPCVTVRNNTERHLTVSNGANVVCGFGEEAIALAANQALQAGTMEWPDIYGPPGAGERIIRRIVDTA